MIGTTLCHWLNRERFNDRPATNLNLLLACVYWSPNGFRSFEQKIEKGRNTEGNSIINDIFSVLDYPSYILLYEETVNIHLGWTGNQ